jgi:NADH-quinone oxidoreductase subunit L
VTHAFFKALLFLSAGSVIVGLEHGLHDSGHHGEGDHHDEDGHHDFDPNDMRNMGGLRTKMKTTFLVYLVGALALTGIPPLAGFFSKDEILADANQEFMAIYILLAIAAIFTAFYMGRQVLMVFFGDPRSDAAKRARENPPVMTLPLIGLAILAVVGGGLNLPGIHSLTDWLEHTLAHVHATEFNLFVAVLSTVLALIAIWIAWTVYGRRFLQEGQPDPLRKILGPLFTVFENKYWVDEFYDLIIVRPYVSLAAFFADVIDWRFWHDWFHDTIIARSFRGTARWLAEGFDLPVIDGAANGLANVVKSFSTRLRALQTGYVRNYALSLFIGLILVLSYILFR